MPVYDTSPVVFEIGSAYTKVGFASDAFPRYIIPSELRDPTTGIVSKLFADNAHDDDDDAFYERMLDFVQNLFFKNVFVHPRERTIVIVESVFCPSRVRETLARILFRQMEAFSVLMLPAHLVALSTLAIDAALVVDLGHRECTVLPVYGGVQLLDAWQAQPIAAEAVHAEIRRQLVAAGVAADLLRDTATVEDIKVRTCFVTTLKRARQWAADDTSSPVACPDVEYPVNGGQVIRIPGRLRETAYEVLFGHDAERASLPYLLLDALLACPLDMRRRLADNVLLMGGTAMAIGLPVRLRDELLELLTAADERYARRLFVDGFKFHSAAPAKPNFTAWAGGSIYGATELAQSRAFTRDAYAKTGHLPDWVRVEDAGTNGRGVGSK